MVWYFVKHRDNFTLPYLLADNANAVSGFFLCSVHTFLPFLLIILNTIYQWFKF